MMIAVQSAVLWARRGVATATNMFVRSFGGVAGLAVMGAIVNHVTGRYGSSSATNQALDVQSHHAVPPLLLHQIHTALFHGIHATFIAALAASALGLVVVFNLPGGSAREHVLEEDVGASSPAPRHQEERGA